MFQPQSVLQLHKAVLQQYGGGEGIREPEMLDSALKRAFQTFGGEELYADAIDKAAAVLQSVIVNHPFVDGNKRTGVLLGFTLLLANNIHITATEDARYDFVISVSKNELSYEEIVHWLRHNSEQPKP